MILATRSLVVSPSKTLKLYYPDIDLMNGDKMLVSGVSGSGKTTLLNGIAGALSPAEGRITILGQRIEKMSSRQLDKIRADHMGIVFQQLNLIPYLTGLQNAFLSLRFSKLKKSRVSDPIAEIIRLGSALGLTKSQLEQKANRLSVGQQQRVAVIRAFLGAPELILADEPTSALDPLSRNRFLDDVIALMDNNRQSLLMISHDPSMVPYFDKTIELN